MPETVLVSVATDPYRRRFHAADPDDGKPLCGAHTDTDKWECADRESVAANGPCRICQNRLSALSGQATDTVGGIEDATVGDRVRFETAARSWDAPLEVSNVDREGDAVVSVTVRGPYGGEYRVGRQALTERPIVHSVKNAGESVGELIRFDILESAAASETDLSVEEVWETAADRAGLSSHVDLEDVLDAFEGCSSLFEASREARISRSQVSSVASALGVAGPSNYDRQFPPQDVDERVAMLRNGELPDSARARYWGGRDE